jgi:hypothetical protein
MRREIFLLFLCFLQFLVCVSPAPRAAGPAPPEVIDEVERTARDALSAWSYNSLWSLWDIGRSSDRQKISQGEFEQRMNRARMKLAAVESVQAQVWDGYATVTARVTLEDRVTAIVGPGGNITALYPGRGRVEVANRTLSLTFEEGRWRISLREFLGMAGAP